MALKSTGKPRGLRNAAAAVHVVVPAVLLYAALLVVPVIYAIYYSFTEYNGLPRPACPSSSVWRTTEQPRLRRHDRHHGEVGAIGHCNSATLGLALLLQRTNRFNTFGRVVMFYPHVLTHWSSTSCGRPSSGRSAGGHAGEGRDRCPAANPTGRCGR